MSVEILEADFLRDQACWSRDDPERAGWGGVDLTLIQNQRTGSHPHHTKGHTWILLGSDLEKVSLSNRFLLAEEEKTTVSWRVDLNLQHVSEGTKLKVKNESLALKYTSRRK